MKNLVINIITMTKWVQTSIITTDGNKQCLHGKQKVIIPLNAYTSYSGSYCLDHRVRTKLADIEKCFNYLDGGRTDDLALNDALTLAQNSGQTKNIDLKYFKVTFYKKEPVTLYSRMKSY